MNFEPDKLDVVELTRALVQVNTITSDGIEQPVLEDLANILRNAGFTCTLVHYDPAVPTRANLIAELNPADPEPCLCLGGHIDTVPFVESEWNDDPLAAVLKDGKIYGRGSADMKGGLAAIICAGVKMAPRLKGRNLALHVYGCEEFGLVGSLYMSRHKPEMLKNIGAVVLGEPTANRPQFGHKGTSWFELYTKGVTAHASMPEKGDNALTKLLPGAARLAEFQPGDEHPYLGRSTFVLSVMHSGLNTNSVPDSAVLKIDCRTVVGQDVDKLAAKVSALAGPDVEIKPVSETRPFWTDPEHTWCLAVRRIVGEVTGTPAGPEVAAFATDAGGLREGLPNAPMTVLGPGAQGMAHKTNECIEVAELREAQDIYEKLIKDWYKI